MRTDVLTNYASILIDYALTSGHGHIDVIREQAVEPLDRSRDKGIVAAAVWLYHDDIAPPPTEYAARRRKACQQWAERFACLDAALAAHHPSIPHHHLAFLAVDGDRRRAGLGTLLIRAHLALLAPSGAAVYAPAATPTARAFYRRHGLHHRLPFPLPDATAQQPAGEPIWPCLRQTSRQPPATGSRIQRPPGTCPPNIHGSPARHSSV
jgi:GNAT superfamily N-acetyltransferase